MASGGSPMNSLEALDYALDVIRGRSLTQDDLVDRPAVITTLETLRMLLIEQNETGQLDICIECGHRHWTGRRFIACHVDGCDCDCLD
jgi:hypothetical protein